MTRDEGGIRIGDGICFGCISCACVCALASSEPGGAMTRDEGDV